MEIADPNFLVKKPSKPRTPAQLAATEKGLAALKARRNELAQKVTKLKAAGPAPVKKAAKVVAPAPAPVVEESEEEEEVDPVPAPAPKPAKAKKTAVVTPAVTPAAPPAFDSESMISAIALRVTESLATRAPKKKVKRVVYEEESSSEEEVVIRRAKPAKAVAAPPPAPAAPPPAPRPMPANVAKSNVLSRLFSV